MIKPLHTIIFFFLSFQVFANSIEQKLMACSQIANESSRLVCFDTATSTINVEDLNADKVASKPIVADKTHIDKEEIFGFERKEMAKTPDKIIATISSTKKNPYGHYIVSLENGQVWQQKDSSSFRLAQGDIIYIKKGALGSFLLGKEGKNKKIRIKRIK